MSEVRRLDVVDAAVMEPMLDGSFRETTIKKRSWQCLGCGLAWAIKWHAESCESRGHRVQWQQEYVRGPIVNGKPMYPPTYYPRYALGYVELPTSRTRRTPSVEQPATPAKRVSCGVYCKDDGKRLVFTSPTGRQVVVNGDDLTRDLIDRCNKAIWDCTPVEVTRDEMQHIREVALEVTDPNPADLALQKAIGLM